MRKVYDSFRVACLKVQINEFGKSRLLPIMLRWLGDIDIWKNVSIRCDVVIIVLLVLRHHNGAVWLQEQWLTKLCIRNVLWVVVCSIYKKLES